MFALWDGEEVNLLGSRHFVRERPLPLAHHRVAFSINLDMIGRLRGERVEVYGSRSAVGLRQRIVSANLPSGLKLAFSWECSEDSDHYPFLAAGIPTVMFHTGLHAEYHRPSDDVHLVNYAGIEPVAGLAFEMLLGIADAADSPAFRENCRSEDEVGRRRLEAEAAPAPPKRWGLATRPDPADPAAPVVVRVSPGTPAARSGLQLRDRIVAIDQQPLVDQEEMVLRLGQAADSIDISVEREGRLFELRLEIDPGAGGAD